MSSPNSIEDDSNGSASNSIRPASPSKSRDDSRSDPISKNNAKNDNSTYSHPYRRHHDSEFLMDNEYTDFREVRDAIITNRRLSEAAHSHSIETIIDKTSLLRLPTEVLLQVFHHLDRKDLFNLLTVCQEFADLIIEILWFRPNMQNDSSFKKIKDIMQLPSSKTHWDYRQFIKRLNLSFMTKLVDDELLSLFIGCPKLERLTLVNCTKLTRNPITQVLHNCEKLQSIDLTGVTDIHDDIINALARNCVRLQGLYAPGCGNVSEEAILNLLESCPMLKRVKFNNSNNISDESILKMYDNCKSLVEIDLHNCPKVTDKYLKKIFLDLSQLREFRISNAPGITDKLFELLPEGFYLEKLRIIDISGCNAITDKLVEKLVLCAPRLRNVVLSKCIQISDASLRALSQLGRSLHYIHLGHCGLITDFGVASLVRACHRIQYIDLACCSQLTDWTLVELANLPKLRRIGLVKCSLITDSGILELVRRRGEQDCLERVHLSYCTNLTIGPIYLLLKSCPKLTHLSLTGISSFLRREITQYCRDPPPDFTEMQKAQFCVFSGNGVNQLRNYLNQVMEERAYSIDQGEIQALFMERRRRQINADVDMDDEEMNIWVRRGLGLLQQDATEPQNPEMVEINREIFRELNEGNMTPEEMRDYFMRLIRNRHHTRIFEHQQQRIEQQVQPIRPPRNPQNAPQITQPPVFPSDDQNIPSLADDEDDVDMEPLFPRNPPA
ncbi:protein required for glucose repression and for glucose and cation transport [Scheffersomyces stipitis CBS 6054]|uniref:Protein required for glucose repression and for glucose and cation transport n=1 Tax=Scheffersomyces stipitis (strain ATCC 58785 / CBS 6054 / NBRC 10063 / NRRL Y-11545) TaxID=322104 RepID=A3LVS5_PICST|nr:protein required for glucose repression and for glucose and cation transport [Scheffersomyces stipitis CBS 6054]ABN67173.2 protein required for glucose repression and for glucose and cation transport [Scheffersomyces stipitis CBS 6054]